MESFSGWQTKAVLVAGAVLTTAITAFFFWKKSSKQDQTPQSHPRIQEKPSIAESRVSVSSELTENGAPEKPLYRESVCDQWQYQVVPNSLTPPARVSNLHYRILMNLSKGLTYEGSVTMSFTLAGYKDNPLDICFNGDQVNHLSVNGYLVPQEDVEYSVQRIRIPPEYLLPNNRIEVIFSNKYSFFDDGMCTYFKINEDNKYSLKEQCIFSRNNRLNAPRIIPCLNQRTQCRVDLQILHPENFQAVSNSEKQLIRLVGTNDFSEYRYFVEDTNVNPNGLNSSFTSRMSTRSVKSKIKYCTKFKDVKLNSIQQLFVACLPVSEVRCRHSLSTLLRFYCRKEIVGAAAELIPQLLNQLEQLEKSLTGGMKYFTRKVDIVFIKSKVMNGYYTRGVIILNEQLFNKALKPSAVYLVLRALLGMDTYRQKLTEIEKLNILTSECYPQIKNLLALKQFEYKDVLSKQIKPDYGDYFMELFHVQVRYLCPDVKGDASTSQWIRMLDQAPSEEYWQHFVNHFEFVDHSIANLLVKLSLKKKNLPESATLLARIKALLKDSKYLVRFLSDEEIEPNLDRLVRNCEKGLRYRLPTLQIHEDSQQILTEGLMRYIDLPENLEECQKLYVQFCHFDDRKNFHHCSIIEEEIARIRSFLPVRPINVDCKWAMNSTRTLSRLDILNKIDPVLRDLIGLYNSLSS